MKNEVEEDIMDVLGELSEDDEIKKHAYDIARRIEKLSLANTLTPQETMALIYLVNGTINTQLEIMLENYICDFFTKHSDDDENGDD